MHLKVAIVALCVAITGIYAAGLSLPFDSFYSHLEHAYSLQYILT